MNALTLERLFTDAVEEGEFEFASGQKGSQFLDAQKVILQEPGFSFVGQILKELVIANDIDVVGGPATGAIAPICAALMRCPWLKGFYVDKDGRVSGNPDGKRALMLDDVITTGGSLANAIKASPIKPVLVTAIVRRGDLSALKEPGMPRFQCLVKLDLN